MNLYLIVILAALIGRYLLEVAADWLNLRHIRESLPAEFEGCCDAGKYRASQQYLRDNTRFGLTSATFDLLVVLVFLLGGGFNWVDRAARSCGFGSIPTGLVFAGMLMLGMKLISLPFAIYDTFVIEERYGFNKTTPRTFALDLAKSLILTALIGGIVLAGILWFFEQAGAWAWLYCWAAVTAFQVVLIFLAPCVIMPLFNKFVPLDEGELKSAIEGYARGQKFRMRGVFKMDGSRRSSKTNAFFTGFGRSRRIVLFDTLIANHTVPELVAIVAHEMGHYKKKHVPRAITRSVAAAGLAFWLLSFFIGNQGLFQAFRMEHVSVYAGLVFFGFLYAPVGMVIALIENAVSRRHEYQADAYAAESAGGPDAMIAALKKLSVDNLSNLTPHPMKVMLSYGHPPVLERIRALYKAS